MVQNPVLIKLDTATMKVVSQTDSSEITGQVVVTMEKSREVEGIKLHFKGMAFVLWSQTKSLRRSVTYSTFDIYCNQIVWLAGGKGEKIVLPAGETSYAFSVTLPPDLPSSFKEEYGKITYEVKASIKRPWKTNFKASAFLNVVAPPLELSVMPPKIMMPVKEMAEKRFSSCLCCRTGSVTLTVTLSSRGAVIGQPFPVTVEVTNDSNVDVHEVVGELKKYTTCRVSSPRSRTMLTKRPLMTFNLGATPRRSTSLRTAALANLSEAVANVDACGIIDVDYYLVVTAITSGMHANVKLKTPVIYGRYTGRSPFTNAGFEPDFEIPEK